MMSDNVLDTGICLSFCLVLLFVCLALPARMHAPHFLTYISDELVDHSEVFLLIICLLFHIYKMHWEMQMNLQLSFEERWKQSQSVFPSLANGCFLMPCVFSFDLKMKYKYSTSMHVSVVWRCVVLCCVMLCCVVM
jgi:hypothetical protein